MAQYKTGSVNVTNGSQSITGVGTLWNGQIAAGDIFTVSGDNTWYEVGSVNSDTSITLSSNYTGTTATGAVYAITRDFTTNKSIPYPQKGDIETASLLKRAMNIIDEELSLGFDSSNVTITGGTINGTTIGATTPSTGAFTTLSASSNVTLSGGTANGVTYLNGSKVLTSGSALTFDGTNLGIGTSSPSAKLQIGWTNDQLRFTNPSGGVKRIGAAYTGYVSGNDYSAIDLGTSGSSGGNLLFKVTPSGGALTTAATIDEYGNLGLGVTPSAWGGTNAKGLQVGNALALGYSNATGSFVAGNAYYSSSGWKRIVTSAATAYLLGGDGTHVWYSTSVSGSADSAITFTQAMTLDASGNLAIGTTSTTYRLNVTTSSGPYIASFYNSNSSTNQYNVVLFQQAASGSATGYIGTGGSAVANTAFANSFVVGTQTASPLVFNTNDTERARIDSSGNLLVGTTSAVANTSLPKFTVSSSTGNAAVMQCANGNTAILTVNQSGTGSYYAMIFGQGGNLSAASVGNIQVNSTTTAYNTSSDYRLKNTIAPMTGALAKVAQLKPCTYKWNLDGSDGEGFIAHELAQVVPQCVSGEKDAVDEQGNPKYQGVDTSFLVATLTAAIKELKAEFDAYKLTHP